MPGPANTAADARGQAPTVAQFPDGIVHLCARTSVELTPAVPMGASPFEAAGIPDRVAWNPHFCDDVRAFDQWSAPMLTGAHGVILRQSGTPVGELDAWDAGGRVVFRPIPNAWDAGYINGRG